MSTFKGIKRQTYTAHDSSEKEISPQLVRDIPSTCLVCGDSRIVPMASASVNSHRLQRHLNNKENFTSSSRQTHGHKGPKKSQQPLSTLQNSTECTCLSENTGALKNKPQSSPTNQPGIPSRSPIPDQLKPTAPTPQGDFHFHKLQQQQQHAMRPPLGPPSQSPDDQPTLWVFGYGSLMWKTDFAFRSKQIGFIKGYERRFYLGNTTFRGRPGRPGRVANLVGVENGKTWGVAFEVHGQEEVSKVLKNLFAREVVSGGYQVMTANFYPREPGHMRRDSVAESSTDSLSSLAEEDDITGEQDAKSSLDVQMMNAEEDTKRHPTEFIQSQEKMIVVKPVQVLFFTVTDKNELYLGPDTMEKMASQVVNAKGSAGSNVEYVTKTADFVRTHIPEDEDSHLFQLDAKVRELVYQAQTHDIERVRLGLSDIAHDVDNYQERPQTAVVKAS